MNIAEELWLDIVREAASANAARKPRHVHRSTLRVQQADSD